MMNYLAALLGLALMGAVTTAAVFRGNAAEWQTKYMTLQASYNSAANKAKSDAAAQEKKDLDALNAQSSQAIANAQSGQKQAQQRLQAFQAMLKADAGMKDPGHVCSGVEIPKDILDGLK